MSDSELIERKYAEAVEGIKEEWFTAESTEWYDYAIALPMDLQVTYLVVVLHNQVFNGGFDQYFVNGYGQFAKETIEALKTIGASGKVALLKEALEIVNTENYPDEEFRKRLLSRAIPELFSGDALSERLENLDDAYYEDDEDIERLLGAYLQGLR